MRKVRDILCDVNRMYALWGKEKADRKAQKPMPKMAKKK